MMNKIHRSVGATIPAKQALETKRLVLGFAQPRCLLVPGALRFEALEFGQHVFNEFVWNETLSDLPQFMLRSIFDFTL